MFYSADTKHYIIPELQTPTPAGHPLIIFVHQQLAPDVMAFLEKMILGFNWPLDQCYHVVIEPNKMEYYNMLWRSKSLKLVITFGISPQEIGLAITPRSGHLIDLGTFMFYQSESLEKIASSKELKTIIWKDLKGFQFTQES